MGQAGKLRDRISIIAPTASQDEYGESIAAGSVWKIRWAEVKATSGSEGIAAGAVTPRTRYEIRLRYVAGLTTDHSVAWKGKVLEINSATPDEKQAWLT